MQSNHLRKEAISSGLKNSKGSISRKEKTSRGRKASPRSHSAALFFVFVIVSTHL